MSVYTDALGWLQPLVEFGSNLFEGFRDLLASFGNAVWQNFFVRYISTSASTFGFMLAGIIAVAAFLMMRRYVGWAK